MNSKRISVRLREDEMTMLQQVMETDHTTNASEFLRLLIHREFKRRRGGEAFKHASYATDFRMGRPAAKCPPVSVAGDDSLQGQA